MNTKIGATRLGFGCAAIPGPLTTREALTLLETAHASGIRHFDTARMYSAGASERVLGELVRQRRGDLVVVTKAGIAPANRLARGLSKIMSALPKLPTAAPRFSRFEPAQIRRSVERSLRKLHLEQVDALLLHEIRAGEVHDELKALLETLHREGKIAACGVATSVEETEALIAAHPDLCAIVQVPATWLDRPRALPAGSKLVIHSVLGPRLSAFLDKLRNDARLARRFKEETGLTAADDGKIGRLMLQASMLRNSEGVTLYSTMRAERIRRNAELLAAKLDASAIHALERAMRAAEVAGRDRESAP